MECYYFTSSRIALFDEKGNTLLSFLAIMVLLFLAMVVLSLKGVVTRFTISLLEVSFLGKRMVRSISVSCTEDKALPPYFYGSVIVCVFELQWPPYLK